MIDGNARDLLSQNVEENFVVKMVVAAKKGSQT